MGKMISKERENYITYVDKNRVTGNILYTDCDIQNNNSSTENSWSSDSYEFYRNY
jgi:hypothetical protein